MNVVTTAAPILLLAVGQTYVIISAGIDLSVGRTMGLASVTSALVIRGLYNAQILPMLPVVIVGALAGIVITILPSLVNGLLIARVKVPAFIATLGMYSIVRGIALLLSGGNTVAALPSGVSEIGNGNLLYILQGNFFFSSHQALPATSFVKVSGCSLIP